jgi:hypothetical protein
MRSTIGCDRVRFSRNVMHTPGDHEYNNAFLNSSSALLCRIWSRADNTVADMNFFLDIGDGMDSDRMQTFVG